MVAVTYGVARVLGTSTAEAKVAAPRKSGWARFLDALIQSRMRQAQREIRMHIPLLPFSLEERGGRLVKTPPADMPFGGW